MKIAIADNNGGKFTTDLREHWESLGHEVLFEPGMSENLAQWADVYYVDTWDNNIHYLYKLYHGDPDHNRTPDWDNDKKPRVIVRALDWEVWIGLARDQQMIDWVDDVIVIAPHIEKELRSKNDWGNKIHLIRPGVNLKRFSLKEKQTDGFQIGMALGDMWWMKNHTAGLDIFTSLYQKDKRWRLHIRGQKPTDLHDYWQAMTDYILDSRGIKDAVTFYPFVGNMNEWYENIDILLHPGLKEAFCYAVGEAMAKGIPAVVNDFMGSRDIWSEGMLYKTHEEAIEMIKELHEFHLPGLGRQYIEKNYSAEQMFAEYDALLGI
jgi:glycosyltransferase involved in cell wall biosynthesis